MLFEGGREGGDDALMGSILLRNGWEEKGGED